MRRIALLLTIVFVLSVVGPALARTPSADEIFTTLKRGFAGVNDYRADVCLTVKGPSVSINDMRMTVCFKKPNKIHIDAAQGMAMVPRGSFFGNPMSELATGARPVYLRSESKLGRNCDVIRLANPTAGSNAPAVTLWIDKEHVVMVAMETSALRQAQHEDGGLKTSWRYEMIDGKYYLPVEIRADMRAPGRANPGQPVKAVIKFTNYRVNKGISDKVFEQEASKPPPARHWQKH